MSALAARQPAIAAKHGGVLRHLALCPPDGRQDVFVPLRRGNAAANRPIPSDARWLQRENRQIWLLWRDGPGRIPHDGQQQRVYQLYGDARPVNGQKSDMMQDTTPKYPLLSKHRFF